jgi:amino acid adenylation domain-containing protein
MDTENTTEMKDIIRDDLSDIYVFPASSVQKYIWKLNNTHSNIAVFNNIYGYQITGRFNYEAFIWAFNKVIENNESLRTDFESSEGTLGQIVKMSCVIDIPVFDYSAMNNIEKEKYIRELADKQLNEPFELKTGPLLRCCIIKLEEELSYVITVIHSLVEDNTSQLIFNKELSLYYNNFIKGYTGDYLPSKLQYADLIMFNLSEEQHKENNNKILQWAKNLNLNGEVLNLSTDYKRPPKQSLDAGIVEFALPGDAVNKLKAFAKAGHKTVPVILLSAFNILLHKYNGLPNITVGIPFSNRILPGTENIIGSIEDVLPVTAEINEDYTINKIIELVHQSIAECRHNQGIAFYDLLKYLNLTNDTYCHPVYQAVIKYENPYITPEFEGLRVSPLKFYNNYSLMDISFQLWENNEIIEGYFKYSLDLFSEDTAERMTKHFLRILDEVCTNADKEVKYIDILTEDEKELFSKVNSTYTEYPANKCIHTLLEEQAFRTPDAVAVQYENEKITYLQLNERANCFADYLVKKGVAVGEYVGVNIERTIDVPVVLLGILKAGAAYIPLDPDFPSERINYMVEEACLKFIVTTSQNKQIFKSGRPVEYILLDTELAGIYKHYSDRPLKIKYNPDNLAYILFTSGSTGKPKGVKIKHTSFVNFISSMAKEPGINRKDILLLVTTLSFDIAGLEIFLPLLTGARTVILPKEAVADAGRLAESIHKYSVTIMQATPATWKLLTESGWTPKPGMKILCGGEALCPSLADKLLADDIELWNMYGPTETCVWSSVKRIIKSDLNISIGRPISNTTFYILDKNLQPVPVGIPGTLYIGGAGVSSGYLNRPELTDKVFIKNPFSSDPESIIYNTGDMAKWKSDGDVLCLGRSDFQVKIRGYRVEIEEIEKQLVKIEGIKEAVVTVIPEYNELNQLAAYIIPADTSVNEAAIRNKLREALPEYMIPAEFSFIKSFPLTPNGKIDRKALTALPVDISKNPGVEFKAPENVLEYKLVQIWEAVLQKKPIGITDNFFDLGGHSLLAAKLFSKINESIGIKIPLAILLNAPTIRELAAVIKRDGHNQGWSPVVPINQEGSNPPLFLIHGAEGNVLLYRELAGYLGKEQPVYGIQSQGLDGLEKFNPEFEYVARFYKEEIRKIQPQGPYLLGGYCLGGTIALEIACQLKEENQEVAMLAMFESYNLNCGKDILKHSYEAVRKIQNMYFHILNYLNINADERPLFLKNKLQTAAFRWKARVNHLLGTIMFNPARKQKYPHLIVKKLNDEAEEKYVPKKYPGEICLYKPDKDFIGMTDYFYGWGQVADVKVFTLPINPKGMLVEPYVKILASSLKSVIETKLKSAG